MKLEARILTYVIGEYYAVFATYRRLFLEELFIVESRVYNLSRVLIEKMKTINEVTYVLPCKTSKYYALFSLPGFKVVEGSDEILLKNTHCRLVELLSRLLDKRGLIMPSDIELIVDVVSQNNSWW